MSKITAIYRAPQGDNRVVDMGGYTFFDGKDTDVSDADRAFLKKLRGNRWFEVTGGDPELPQSPANSGLVAVHRGRGVYAVSEDGVVLDKLDPMNKAEADAFNALSDEDKAAFVDKPADTPAPVIPPAPAA